MAQYQTMTDPTQVVFRRIVAYLIDGFLLSALTVGIFFAMADFTVIEGARSCIGYEVSGYICTTLESNGEYSVALFKTSALMTALGITTVWGITFNLITQGLAGWTPGKLICGIRVVNEQGTGPGIGRAFIRGLLMIVDGLCSNLVGLIVMLTTKGHRRVGDLAAKTFVVRSSARGTPVLVPGLTAPVMTPGMTPAPAMPYTPPSMPTTPPNFTPPTSGFQATPPAPGATAPSGISGSEPQWDPQRNTWIQWDGSAQVWNVFDSATRTWKPIS